MSEQAPAKAVSLRERKKARTRRSIQRHTLRLIEENGFADTTVEMIAEAAEISPSTFFRYFRNKEEAAVADFMNEQLYHDIIAAPPELGLLDAIVLGIHQTVEGLSPEDWHYQQLRSQLVRSIPELQRGMMEAMVRPVRMSIVIAAQRLHLDESSIEAKMYGGAIVGALVGLMLPEEDADIAVQSQVSQENLAGYLELGVGMLAKVLSLPNPE